MENKEAIRMLWKQKEYLRNKTELKNADTATLDRTCYGALTRAIEALHSERPKGEWIRDDMGFICDDCNFFIPNSYMMVCKGKPLYNFCPNCGADLREEEDEDDVE